LSIVKIGTEFVAVIPSEGKYYLQFILKPTTPNHFDFISFSKGGAGYTLIRNMVYANGRLVGTPYKKHKKQDFISLPKNTPRYEFRTIDEKIAYLRLGSFYASNANIAESKKFFEQISISKNIKHLIVDLRDNGGGGYKTSKRFLDLIKSFNGKVHLLTNSYTVSNAEQFTVDLMDDKNVIRYGEATRGTISYGSNTDVVLDLPSKRFKFYITDMTNRNKDLPFESYGIEPQIKLDPFQKDWVAQVIEIIKKN
jgi:C-terminal processing protease CtpA/Prc